MCWTDLEDPVRQPTDDVDGDDGEYHSSYSAPGLSSARRAENQSHSTYSDHHEGVEDADEKYRHRKRQRERVRHERLVGADETVFRPLDRAGRRVAVVNLSRTDTIVEFSSVRYVLRDCGLA